jgi:uncharacterized RDD family membrane protein YckC
MTENHNPYSPPRSDVTVPEARREIVPASKGRRFGTLLVDYVMFMVLSACVGAAVALLFGQAGVDAMQSIPDIVFGVLILSAYYIFFEGIWARTPGKFLLGTVVVAESGTKPGIKQVVGRTLCRFIPFEALSFFGERGWHDSISKTHVVMARA